MAKANTDAKTVKAVVLLDSYRWHAEHGNLDSEVLEADKGEEIEVSQAEFDRGARMTPAGLAKPGSRDAKAVAQGDSPPSHEPPAATTPAGELVDGVELDPDKDVEQ